MDAENTYQVFDWLWTSGQLSRQDIEQLPALSIHAVINLALPTSSNALPGEAELITGLGITYLHIPVLWEQPTLVQLQQFCAALECFKSRSVWVHCAKNMRVSAFIYLYRRLYLREPDAQAAHPLREVWTPNEVWQQFITHALHELK